MNTKEGDSTPVRVVADVRHQTRDEWVEARLEAVRHGDDPALRLPSNRSDRR